MADAVQIKLEIANDLSSLTVNICDIDGPVLAHATLGSKQLRQLVTNLAQALVHLEGGKAPPTALTGQEMEIPLPIPMPAWRVGELDTGDPVIAVELYPHLWTSFSLSVSDAQKIARLLRKSSQTRRSPKPEQKSKTDREQKS